MADAAVEQNTEEYQRAELPTALSQLRTVRLALSLAIIVFIVVVAVVTVTGFVGAALVDAGLVSLASLTSTHNAIVVILVGSAIIAVLMAFDINQTLITPLRSATAAVNELARQLRYPHGGVPAAGRPLGAHPRALAHRTR